MSWIYQLCKRHFSNGIWVLSINLARQILSLLFLMIMVRIYSQGVVGEFQLILAAVAFCTVFALPGMTPVITQAVARGHPGTFRICSLYTFVGSLLGGAALIVFAITHDATEEVALRNGLIVAGTLFPFAYGLTGWVAYQTGLSQFKRNAIWQGLGHVTSYGGMTLALLMSDPGIAWLVAISLGTLATLNVAATLSIFQRVPRDKPEPGSLLHGFRTSGYHLANSAGNHIDKFMLFYFLAPEALAIFVVAERIPEIIKKYISAVRTILMPGFSKKTKYTQELNKKIHIVSALISVILAFIIFAIIPWFIPLAFGESYRESIIYCQLLLGTIIIGQSSQTKMTFIMSRYDDKGARNIILGGNAVRVLSSLIFIPLIGILGAILSAALYRLCTAAFVWHHLRRHHLADAPQPKVR